MIVLSLCDFIAGWSAGISGLLVGHPADTIKVRQQTQVHVTANMNGECGYKTQKIGVTRKIHNLYRGMSFPLVSSGGLNSVFFGVYGNTLRFLQNYHEVQFKRRSCSSGSVPNKYWELDVFLAGCTAGLAQSVFACPVELIKVKLQAQPDTASPSKKEIGVIDTMKRMHKIFGWRGFYRGYLITLCRDVPSFGIYILTYEHLLSLCWPGSGGHIVSSTHTSRIFAGGFAGIVSWLSILPIDVIKSRIQADSLSNPQYKGIIDCIIKSYRNDGMAVFGRGFWMLTLRAFPVNAATFVGYEWCLTTCEDFQARRK